MQSSKGEGGTGRGACASRMRLEKLAEFFEAIYASALGDEEWLRGVSIATRDVWGRSGAYFSSFYDASEMEFRPLVVVGDISTSSAPPSTRRSRS